jgi:hypothetical protein
VAGENIAKENAEKEHILPENPQLVFEYDPKTGGIQSKMLGQIPAMPLIHALEIAALRYKLQQIAAIEMEAKQNQSVKRVLQASAGGFPKF